MKNYVSMKVSLDECIEHHERKSLERKTLVEAQDVINTIAKLSTEDKWGQKPCPMCGGEIKLVRGSHITKIYTFICDKCLTEFRVFEKLENMNNRAWELETK